MDKWLVIQPSSDSPFNNLATEEYLLHHFDENIIFLYVNTPSVVIGKHQNAFDECNTHFCKQKNIETVRRLSGGGTVFHGPGNLNFCLIQNGKELEKLIDFKKNLAPVNQALHELGLASEYSGRNDLLLHGFKISGNAEHVFSKKKRVIHHGTLLFDADLKSLNQAIRPKSNIHFKSHAVKSVRSQVANIVDYLSTPMSFEEFQQHISDSLVKQFGAKSYVFSEQEKETIQSLAESKYKTWEWNYGYSPSFESVLEIDSNRLEVKVKKGIIQEAKLINEGGEKSIDSLIEQAYTAETLQQTGLGIDFSVYF